MAHDFDAVGDAVTEFIEFRQSKRVSLWSAGSFGEPGSKTHGRLRSSLSSHGGSDDHECTMKQ
jgi:hypothetical protein